MIPVRQGKQDTSKRAGGLLLAAVLLSSLLSNAVIIAASRQISMQGDLLWSKLIATSTLMTLGLSATVLTAIALVLGARKSHGRLDSDLLAGGALVVLAVIEVFSTTSVWSRSIYLGAVAIIQATIVWGTVRSLTRPLNLTEPMSRAASSICMAIMAFCGVATFVAQTWIEVSTMASASALVREGILLAAPAVTVLIAALVLPRKNDAASLSSMREAIRMRLPTKDEGKFWRGELIFHSILALLSIGVIWAGGANLPVLAMHLGPVLIIVRTIRTLAGWLSQQRQTSILSRLTGTSVRKFLSRHSTDKPAWAATVGLRTSNFMVDHDPDGQLENHLPATLLQIRSEEIQRCISEILGTSYLHNHVVGHRVWGSVDPENSTRPCVDVLKMISCLYLDAGPLIERRLKGLTQLLPMIDPGLAKVLRFEDISRIMKRSSWFFHFDYGWVDQHVVHTPQSTRYGVQMSSVTGELRESMLAWLRGKSSLGNFIWIGSEARDRLLQEAPGLANIIEACPIPSESKNSETLVFILKFEQLIPRLQRYFDLDSTRRVLLDFDPGPEASKLLGLFNVQLTQASSAAALGDVVKGVVSWPWRGFKEKDSALRLVLEVHARAQHEINSAQSRGIEADPVWIQVRRRVHEAVELIGYPSQILHHAHVDKITLRDANNLFDAASKPRHPRFHEAWMLLATADPNRWFDSDRARLLDFLIAAASNRRLSKNVFVMNKAIETLAGFARQAKHEEIIGIRDALRTFAGWLAREEASVDSCCLYLDTLRYVLEHLRLPVKLDEATVTTFEHWLYQLQSRQKSQDNMLIALLSRWQELKLEPTFDARSA
jgi:hypothetical protein